MATSALRAAGRAAPGALWPDPAPGHHLRTRDANGPGPGKGQSQSEARLIPSPNSRREEAQVTRAIDRGGGQRVAPQGGATGGVLPRQSKWLRPLRFGMLSPEPTPDLPSAAPIDARLSSAISVGEWHARWWQPEYW